MNVTIRGPVLLLMGPLGSFFSRFADFLLTNNVPTQKVMFPLREVFPRKKHVTLEYDRPMEEWRSYLSEIVGRSKIRHIFMYGDFAIPHRIAIALAQELDIEAWVFELGYIRPHYVTLERNGVNARSNLNKPITFYQALPDGQLMTQPEVNISSLWRKIWKVPCFIQHALTNYQIVDRPHKLQPKLSYLFYQVRGCLRKPWYALCERRQKKLIRSTPTVFLAVLQVSIDSQVTQASAFQGIEHFITQVMESFARHSLETDHLAFKHHPADRGYNNYGTFIRKECRRLNLGSRVQYIHDDNLPDLFRHSAGVIAINSTVGLDAIKHLVPTKVLGTAFYNLPGLTAQVSLDEFWKERPKVDETLLVKFHNFVVEQTQINGHFSGYFPFEKAFTIERSATRSASP